MENRPSFCEWIDFEKWQSNILESENYIITNSGIFTVRVATGLEKTWVN